jgi:cytidine deaminase
LTKERPAASKETPAVPYMSNLDPSNAMGRTDPIEQAGLAAKAELVERAAEAARSAYAPYSAFRVGAALLTKAGAVVTGCNVENASFPVGGCAERHAIAAAVMGEGPEMRLAAIAVVALDPLGEPVACAPCGACRQAILEFGADARVIFLAGQDGMVEVAAAELLPGAFSFAPVRP